MKYTYTIMTLRDTKPRDSVFVPNTDADTTIQIWRYLTGLRPDFPEYDDHSLLIMGMDEDAWCSPKEYREAYCPPDMACIVRRKS